MVLPQEKSSLLLHEELNHNTYSSTSFVAVDSTGFQNLLSVQWKPVLSGVLGIYFVLQIIMGFHGNYLGYSLCSDSHTLPEWVWFVNLFVVLCFFISSCNILWKMTSDFQSQEEMGARAANLSIKIIAGSSSLLTLCLRWGGICRDGYGYSNIL